MVSADDEEAIFDMIDKVLKDHELYDHLYPMAINEAGRNEGKNLRVLKRFMKNEAQFKNAVLQQVGYASEEFNVDFQQDPDTMLRDYFDRFAITKADNPKAFEVLAERAQANFKKGAASSLPIAATAGVEQAQIVAVQRFGDWISGTAGYTDVMVALDKSAKLAKSAPYLRCAGAVLTVGFMGYDFYINVKNWRSGKIDGAACSRNISSSIAGVGAGFAGAMGGAALAGPAGAFVGGVMGALLVGQATSSVFDLILGDDRERAAIECYKVLGLTQSATNEDIRKEYLKLAKVHHPDKNNGENTAKFVEINTAYELIRAERVAQVTTETIQF